MEALLELEPQDVELLPREDKVRLAELLKDQRRRLARDNFLNYAQYVRPDYKIAPHLEKIASKLEAVERGEIDRLMIFLHPRAGKSLTCSIIFPAWYFGRNPRNQIIASAYGESLVAGFGARIRNIMSSPEHKEVFGLQGSLSGEAQARDHFLTQAGGVYRASGVGGAITGFGANCFPGETKIAVPGGSIRIDAIKPNMRVLTCDPSSGRLMQSRVLATRGRDADNLVRVRTVAGRSFRATAEHPVHVPGVGWREAGSLAPGDPISAIDDQDTLRELPGACRAQSVRGREETFSGPNGNLLRPRVPGADATAKMRDMWEAATRFAFSWGTVLFQRMPTLTQRAQAVGMPAMLEGIPATQPSNPVLLKSLRKPCAFGSHGWGRQFALQGRNLLRSLVQVDETADTGKRYWLCDLRDNPSSCNSPHRPSAPKQSPGKSRGDLPDPSRTAPQVQYDAVAVVEHLRDESEYVYDIQVEGTSCFFAEQVLVHNCLIIDDPVRGREDADSEIMRNKVWEWWQNDAYTRLMPGGAVLVIMTRWHESDLAGRLLEEAHGEWDILHIPAINTDGEACWPEMFDLDALGRIKRDVGHRTWQALYQGDPIPDSGNFFQKEWFHQVPKHYSPEDVSNRLITTYGCSDYAVSGGGGDWTVHVVAGIDPDDNIHILDMYRGQTTPDIWADKMIDMHARWKTVMWAEGRGGIQKAVEPYIVKRQMERGTYFARVQIQETQSKRERAIAFQGRMASGKVFWPKNAGWYGTAETELLRFDAGKNDDIVDALSLLGQMLASMAPGRNPPKPPDQMGVVTIGDYESNHGPQITWNEVIERSKKLRRQGR